MLDALIGGLLGGIGILIAAGLLILLIGFLFGTTIGKVILVLIGIGGLFALFVWFGKRAEKKKLPPVHSWQLRCDSTPSFQPNQQPDPYLGFAPTEKPQQRITSEDLEDTEIIVPQRYQFFAQQIQPVIALLKSAFVNRKVPDGVPWPDIQAEIVENCRRLSNCTANLESYYNRMGQTLYREDVTDDQICQSVQEVKTVIEEMTSIYRNVWYRPFPPGMEQGQILVSAIVERVMRIILDNLEQSVFIVENPREAVVHYGVAQMNLQLVLEADREIKALNQWLSAQRLSAEHCENKEDSASKSDDFVSMAAIFLLGWWIGRDR